MHHTFSHPTFVRGFPAVAVQRHLRSRNLAVESHHGPSFNDSCHQLSPRSRRLTLIPLHFHLHAVTPHLRPSQVSRWAGYSVAGGAARRGRAGARCECGCSLRPAAFGLAGVAWRGLAWLLWLVAPPWRSVEQVGGGLAAAVCTKNVPTALCPLDVGLVAQRRVSLGRTAKEEEKNDRGRYPGSPTVIPPCRLFFG